MFQSKKTWVTCITNIIIISTMETTLVASVNIIPLLAVKIIRDLEIGPTAEILHMAVKTCRKSVGTIKYVLINVDNLVQLLHAQSYFLHSLKGIKPYLFSTPFYF